MALAVPALKEMTSGFPRKLYFEIHSAALPSILPFFLTLLISLALGISASARCVFPNKLLDGESGGANLYAFVNNNPAGGIDVLGYATYFSNPYTLNSSTNYNGVSTFDRGAFSRDFQKLSSEFQSIYSRAGSKFATKELPNSVEYRNDFSNFGSYWGGVWNRNIAKNTSFNNDYWEPYHSRELTAAFLGNPLSFSGMGYGMLNQAIGGLSSLRGYAESNPYDPQGMWTRASEIGIGTINTPGHILAEVFNSIALPRITTGEEVVFNGWNRPLSLNTVSTESRYAEAAFTFLPLGVVDDAARLSFKGEAYVARGGAANTAVRWGPATGSGPLAKTTIDTFRGGSYTQAVTQEATTLYRAYGGSAGELGSYWSRTAPTGPLQARIDSALLPQWGNTAEKVSTMTIPKGTTIYEGFAAPQGNLMGGGSQIYIPR